MNFRQHLKQTTGLGSMSTAFIIYTFFILQRLDNVINKWWSILKKWASQNVMHCLYRSHKYWSLSQMTTALPLSAGLMMILLCLRSEVSASDSYLVRLDLTLQK